MTCRLERRTVDREREDAEMRAAAIDATWEAVEALGSRPFSYTDIGSYVHSALADLGYDTHRLFGWSPNRLIKEMADAGILLRVRAFSPPSSPHLFILPEDK